MDGWLRWKFSCQKWPSFRGERRTLSFGGGYSYQNWVVATQIFFMFNPIWGRWSQFDEHIFQTGWFNHQLEKFLMLKYVCLPQYSQQITYMFLWNDVVNPCFHDFMTHRSRGERNKPWLHPCSLTWKLGAYLARFNVEVLFQDIPQEHQGKNNDNNVELCWPSGYRIRFDLEAGQAFSNGYPWWKSVLGIKRFTTNQTNTFKHRS